MKSVIVANDFLTTLANNDVSKLTRGQAVLLNSAGKVVAAVSDVKDDEMLQFVLGLGDGKVKRGVWINSKWSKQHKEKYLAPVDKTYKFTNLVANRGIGYQGFDAEVIISCKPINSFGGYPLEVYNASVTINGIDETSADIIARLKVEVKKTLTKINARFGADSITIDDFTEASVTFTGAAGFEYYVTFDGILRATLEEGTENQTPVGTYDQVAKLEKEADVAGVGYNPNFKEYDRVYGDIFTATEGVRYNTYVITSRADFTHPFNLHTEGLQVTQFIAIDNTNTSAITKLEGVLALIK